MADTPKVYALCGSNCKYETLTKEQILTAITEAIATGSIGNCDTGFITTIKTINGNGLKFFVGTQAEYNELSDADKQGLFAIITDDATKDGIYNLLNGIINGTTEVSKAKSATVAYRDRNGQDIITDRLLRVPDYPTGRADETDFYFPLGTLFTVKTGTDGLKLYEQIKTKLTFFMYENGGEVVYNGADANGDDIVSISGTWMVIGKCGSETVNINGYDAKFNYYLITKVEN